MTTPLEEAIALDAEALLGETVHIVCCEADKHPNPIIAFCGKDVTPEAEYNLNEVASTCATCVEKAETDHCPAIGRCPYPPAED
jgi:hypothetical protein